MTLYLDASAIVAILAREPEAGSFDARLGREPDRITSATSIWEAVRGLAGARGLAFEEARAIVADFVTDFSIRLVPVAAEEAELALDAHQNFGRNSHPANLNFGDCFAYACAKRHNADILFKGGDFIHTDLRDATLT